MTPEGKVEAYLHERVKATGGQWRRVKWIGRKGAPDDLAWWPDGTVAFIETKRPRGKLEGLQRIEHKRLKETGLPVYVVDSPAAIDNLLAALRFL